MNHTETRITKVGTVIVPVSDQDRALDFYTRQLGFEQRMDIPWGDDRSGRPLRTTSNRRGSVPNRARVLAGASVSAQPIRARTCEPDHLRHLSSSITAAPWKRPARRSSRARPVSSSA